MKKFLKIFGIVLVAICLLGFAVWEFYISRVEVDNEATVLPEIPVVEEPIVIPKIDFVYDDGLDHIRPVVHYDETLIKANKLYRISKDSKRVNMVVFAHDGLRADTIMFVSFDGSNQSLDVINIPRDTYWPVEGYMTDRGNKLINAVYGRGKGLGGSKGMKQAVSDLLGVPVDYFVKLNYDGAASIVDAIGGVEIYVPFDMDYDDDWAEPPLHIHLAEGLQVLDGKNSVDYLRWRKNNDEKNSGGDLPRISRMQKFMKAALKEAISPKLPSFVGACFDHIYTDMGFDHATKLGLQASSLSSRNINFKKLPGTVVNTYYMPDQLATKNLLLEMYVEDKSVAER